MRFSAMQWGKDIPKAHAQQGHLWQKAESQQIWQSSH